MDENYFYQSDSERDTSGKPTGTYCIWKHNFTGGAGLDRSDGELVQWGLSLQVVSKETDRLNKEEQERQKLRDGV